MRFDVITIFPEMFGPFATTSIVGRACERGLASIEAHDLRGWAHDAHRTVDDYPYGGGAGMVMRPEPFFEAVEDITARIEAQGHRSHRVLLAASGQLFKQDIARELSQLPQVTLMCGHYKDVDARVENLADDILSVGDYVLSGGELPAMVLIDSVIRLLPGAVNTYQSVEDDSHYTEGLLGYPSFTRPAEYRGLKVPEVLLSGNHAHIEAWRRAQALERTRRFRPDLLARTGGAPSPSPAQVRTSPVSPRSRRP